MNRMILAVAFFILGISQLQAQYYFGRNKVQYDNFEWHILKTEHFDIYYYPEMKELAEIGAASDGKALRVAVSGGGCSGFQYEIDLDAPKDDDLVLEGAGEKVVIDSVSLPFLASATIDFADELIGARFVIENPNATSSCGCGTSFSI